jgi:hypothetical protein
VDVLEVFVNFVEDLKSFDDKRKNLDFLNTISVYKIIGGGRITGRRTAKGKDITILAYCGGLVNPKTGVTLTNSREFPKTKCGYEPLLITKHITCNLCGKLICPKCNTCALDCQEFRSRVEEHNLQIVQGVRKKKNAPRVFR